jgi:hypothetical protein
VAIAKRDDAHSPVEMAQRCFRVADRAARCSEDCRPKFVDGCRQAVTPPRAAMAARSMKKPAIAHGRTVLI